MNKLSERSLIFSYMHKNDHEDNQKSIEPQDKVNSNSTNFVNQDLDGQNATGKNVADRIISIAEQNQLNKNNCISCRSRTIVNELKERIQNPPGKAVAGLFFKVATLGLPDCTPSSGCCMMGGDGVAIAIALLMICAILVICLLIMLVGCILWGATELIIYLNARKDSQKLATATLVDNFIQHLDNNISETESIKLNCDLKQLNKLMLDSEIMNVLNKFKKPFNELHNPKSFKNSDTIISNHKLVKDLTSQLFTNLFAKLDEIVDNESADKLKQVKQQYLNSFFNPITGIIDPSKRKLLECILSLDTQQKPIINKYFLDAMSDGIKQYIADNNLKQTNYISLYDFEGVRNSVSLV